MRGQVFAQEGRKLNGQTIFAVGCCDGSGRRSRHHVAVCRSIHPQVTDGVDQHGCEMTTSGNGLGWARCRGRHVVMFSWRLRLNVSNNARSN